MKDERSFKNKQIGIEDIIRMSDMFEEYSNEWKNNAKEDEEYVNSIPDSKKEYDDFSVKLTYDVDYKDGRELNGNDYNWLVQNIDDLEQMKRLEIYFRMTFHDYKHSEDKFNGIYNMIGVEVYLNLDYFEQEYKVHEPVRITSSCKNLNDEMNALHSQLDMIKQELDEQICFTKDYVLRYAKILEGYSKEWKEKVKSEEEYINSLPSKKTKITSLTSEVKYTIEWYDGREKSEKDKDWFINNIRADANEIEKIDIRYHLHYVGNTKEDEEWHDIECWIRFDTWWAAREEKSYDSHTFYEINATNMEQEADKLYAKIEDVFKDNPVRYDKTIKNRFLRIQAFSTAVGIILSYVLFIILKLFVKDGVMVTLLASKKVIVFGQWCAAVVLGNIFASWFMNLLYKKMLPKKKSHYNVKSGKTVHTELIDEYIADSELQFGVFTDLRQKRELIEKIYKISGIILLVQLVISVILYLVLK